jgi:serine protease Do
MTGRGRDQTAALRRIVVGMSALLSAAVAVSVPVVAGAQSIGDVFRKVNPAVVVIRAKRQDVEGPGGLTRFTETGSGVLVTADGKVMTAAHVVHAMDEIAVEFLGGETVPARVVSSEPDADLSLLKLERVPQGVGPATLGNSDTVRVGDQVLVIGAPYASVTR